MWQHSVAIPDWMKEYMDYHTEVVQNLTPQNWVEHKYLVLRCYRKDDRCGGLSDRLKPVPLILLAAQRSQRILFIDWDRPVELQNFLVPPRNGFQWLPPRFLASIFRSSASNEMVSRASYIISKAQTSNAVQVHTHLQDFRGGETQFDEQLGQGSFQAVYHDLFRIFFEPSPGIQALIDRHLIREPSSKVVFSRESLIEGQYSVAHYRAEYGKEIQRHPILSDPDFLTNIAINAVRCASELQTSSVPIYFASDNPLALKTVRQLAQAVDYPIVTFHREEDIPKHLDKYDNDTRPSDYYSTFVDLYLAGSGRCVTYGRGGFGRFASLLSFNATCSSKHVKQFFANTCYGRPPFQID
jgi:hypothetical protein